MTYKKYDAAIKKMIALSGQVDLFPDLNIPRTTQLYWINQSKELKFAEVVTTTQNDFYSLKKEIFNLNAKLSLLQKINAKILDLKPLQSLLGLSKKEFIVKTVDEMRGILPVRESMQLIGVTSDQYYRWRSEVYGCSLSRRFCDSTRPNQLTRQEQKILVDMAKDKKYAHMSIKSLMYYAQREGILYCGYESWLKYIKINQVERIRLKRHKRKVYREGIRAHRPHEIWHIDIMEIDISGGEKFYLQMIVDNYSRAILSWKVSDKKDTILSIKTIKNSIRKGDVPDYLMSDAGKENTNHQVIKLLMGKGICHVIAQSDVHFSNSMIEALFRKFRGVTNLEKVKTLNGLRRKVAWFTKEYNLSIPHSKLSGALPIEMLSGEFRVQDFNSMIYEKRLELIHKRSFDYQRCRTCRTQ